MHHDICGGERERPLDRLKYLGRCPDLGTGGAYWGTLYA